MKGEGLPRRHLWLVALVVAAVVAAHVVALRAAWSRMALPAALLLVGLVIAKHLGLAAIVRSFWRRRSRT